MGVLLCMLTTMLSATELKPSAYSASLVETGADMACGPRAVHFIAEHYGLETDLMTLVKEIQMPRIEDGSNVAQLSDALNDLGIQTYAMRIPKEAILDWPFPVLIHLQPRGADIGHFAVLLPPTNGGRSRDSNAASVFMGVRGVESASYSSLAERMSGVVVLTSLGGIEENDAAIAINERMSSVALVATQVIVIGLAMAIVFVWTLKRLEK